MPAPHLVAILMRPPTTQQKGCSQYSGACQSRCDRSASLTQSCAVHSGCSTSCSYAAVLVKQDGAGTPKQGRRAINLSSTFSWTQDSGVLPLSLSSIGRSNSVWGWLEGCDKDLPHALLQGQGLAIGRSREAFEARRVAISVAASESGAIQDTSPSRRSDLPT